MAGKLDEISRIIGAIETSVGELRSRAEEDRETRDRWHAENRAAIMTLTQKLDRHAEAVELLRPAVAALELSRSKLAALASIGFAGSRDFRLDRGSGDQVGGDVDAVALPVSSARRALRKRRSGSRSAPSSAFR